MSVICATFPGIHSGLYVPLKVGDRAIGSIAVESNKTNAFSENDQRLLETISAQAAIAIENAHLYLKVQKQLEERQQAEVALRESEAQYRLLAENMSDTVWLMDMNLKTVYISPSVIRTRGFTLEEINSIPLDQQMTADLMNRAMALFARALSPENLARHDAQLTL